MKNKRILKLLSSVLVALLIISVVPVNSVVATQMKSSADNIIKSIGEAVADIDISLSGIAPKAKAANNYWFNYNIDYSTSTLTITGGGTMPSYKNTTAPWYGLNHLQNVVIEGDFENISGYAFSSFLKLKTVKITGAVKTIDSYAFKECKTMQSITLPETLETISSYAFKDCIGLTEIVIPDSVTVVGKGAFSGCYPEKLTTPFSGSGSSGTAKDKTNQLAYIFGSVEYDNTYRVTSTADKSTLYIPYSLKEVTLTKRLMVNSFKDMKGIEKITVGETVGTKKIPVDFANGCTSLRELEIKNSVITEIGVRAFKGCSALEDVTIPDTVTVIQEFAFSDCSSLAEITFPNGEFYTRRSAFAGTKFMQEQTEEFVIVGDGVLLSYNGTGTSTVTIPEGVKSLSCPFEGRTDISTIKFPDSLKSITPDSFYGCTLIVKLTVPNTVEKIYQGAFNGMCSLRELTVPFVGETKQAQSDTKESLFSFWFASGSSTCNVCNGKKCTSLTQKYNYSKESITGCVPRNLTTLTINGGTIHQKCISSSDITTVTIGSKVECIEEYGLSGAEIETLTFSSGFKPEELPDYAFAYNNIEKVTIPTSVKKMGSCFVGNPLESIKLHEGLEVIDGTFENTDLQSVKFPTTLKKILGNAFAECTKLNSIVISENVDEINNTAFWESGVTYYRVHYNNTHYYWENGIVYDMNGVLVLYPFAAKKSVFQINEKVTEIPRIFFTYFDDIEAFEVAEGNQNYFSCDGVLYSASGELLIYPERKKSTTLVLDERVTYVREVQLERLTWLEGIDVAEKNTAYTSIDGVLYNKDVTILIKYPQQKSGDYTAPDTLQRVLKRAFYNVKGLDKVVFPNDVVLEQDCFENADVRDFTAVNLPDYLPYYFGGTLNSPMDIPELEKLTLTNQTSDISPYFATYYDFTQISINGSFEYIGDCAFRATSFSEIKLPDTVKGIGDRAFAGFDLEKIYLGQSLEYIGKDAFNLCPIKNIHFPDTLTTLDDGAFSCTDLTEIKLGDNITTVGDCVFGSSKLVRAVISENLVDMSDKLFQNCSDLEIVILGGAVENVGSESFAECTSLETVVIPDSVTQISQDAFLNANEDMVIYCNEGSYAEEYAVANNIKYTTLIIGAIENQVYTGEVITPKLNVFANNKKLTENAEYSVSYKDNINAGSAKAIARGLGDFKHLIATARFEILPKNAEEITILCSDLTYDPDGVTPELFVYNGNSQLVEGIDYSVIGLENATTVGRHNYAVEFSGNYTGIVNSVVRINARSLEKTNITYGDTVKVTDRGVALQEGVDYIVEYTEKSNGDKVTTVKGIGNYCGTSSRTEKGNPVFNWLEALFEAIRNLFSRIMGV